MSMSSHYCRSAEGSGTFVGRSSYENDAFITCSTYNKCFILLLKRTPSGFTARVMFLGPAMEMHNTIVHVPCYFESINAEISVTSINVQSETSFRAVRE